VHNGFSYKVAAGDAETPEYQVRVRSTPLVEKIDVLYHYRPYLGWKDETSQEPNLKAPRGAEVTLTAHTNRSVKTGVCTLHEGKDARQQLPGEPLASDPHALKFRFTIERDGEYRISFTSTEGEASPESLPYTITALRDYPPTVELKKPGKNISLPVNGLLELEGFASDDNGVAGMTLRLKVVDGPMLQAKPYRAGKSFRLQDGGYPKMLEYKDSVELEKLMDEQGKLAALKPKMEIEYWLKAADACDYPGPNVAASQHYKVILGEPNQDQKHQQAQREQAAEDQKKHEQNQDQKLKEENKKKKHDSNSNNRINRATLRNPRSKGIKATGAIRRQKTQRRSSKKPLSSRISKTTRRIKAPSRTTSRRIIRTARASHNPARPRARGIRAAAVPARVRRSPTPASSPARQKAKETSPMTKRRQRAKTRRTARVAPGRNGQPAKSAAIRPMPRKPNREAPLRRTPAARTAGTKERTKV
jgi:hypothetical protein